MNNTIGMKIIKKVINNEDRFIIIDEDGVVLDDAQGYGFKTRQKAFLCYNYKNNNELKKERNRCKKFWKENKEIKEKIETALEINWKDIFEYTEKELIEQIQEMIKENYDKEVDKKLIKYLLKN